MLNSKDLRAEDVANYAVMNCSDSDHVKTVNVEDLINRLLDLEALKLLK